MGGSQSTRKLSVDNDSAIAVSQEALDRIQAQLNAKQAEQPPPPVQYTPPSYFESQKRQQENASEEAYWARRIENLKRAHEKINSGMHLEYQKTLKEANELFDLAKADKIVSKLPPCQEEKTKIRISEALLIFRVLANPQLVAHYADQWKMLWQYIPTSGACWTINKMLGIKVLECYGTNPDKSLLCSVLVNEFNDCVCKSRIAAVSATS